jgi:hypothetical protein
VSHPGSEGGFLEGLAALTATWAPKDVEGLFVGLSHTKQALPFAQAFLAKDSLGRRRALARLFGTAPGAQERAQEWAMAMGEDFLQALKAKLPPYRRPRPARDLAQSNASLPAPLVAWAERLAKEWR